MNAVAGLEHFARDDFLAGKEGVGLSKVDDQVSSFHAAGDTGDDFAFAVNVFVINNFAFRIADFLEDNLLGGLGVDASEIGGFDFHTEFIANNGFGIQLACFL
ncbi:MAG: hypothetical protein A2070_07635 [Bdellovibrionales bacterium GWC1_52_8]|nr:MAG: hypothetical protein A2070_07635 [Bdellovibrionales bacterium GWC1_52_8]